MTVVAPAVLDDSTDYVPTAQARRLEARSYLSLVRIIGQRVPQPAPSHLVPVVLVPGFLSGDFSLTVLARQLRRAGHRTFASHIGANLGCTEEMVKRLVARVDEVAAAEGRRIALVGHSRGGMIVKLAAQRRPELVESIVVLSAPVTGTLSVAAHIRKQLEMLFRLQERGLRRVISQDCVTGECAARIADELDQPFPTDVAYTSIYSRADAIIDWKTCLDPAAELVEVRASHTGMATDPDVLRIVTDRLAQLASVRTI
ncbi:MAG TPA: alpha/beta fold hydrolase [Jatrophihabitantaceae bacterium]|nr:alpha/beta fold hydrolase [Jatrophihabitantaceae bacterium]